MNLNPTITAKFWTLIFGIMCGHLLFRAIVEVVKWLL